MEALGLLSLACDVTTCDIYIGFYPDFFNTANAGNPYHDWLRGKCRIKIVIGY